MITVWTKGNPSKTYTSLSPVIKNVPGLPIKAVTDLSILPETRVILGLGTSAAQELEAKGIVRKKSTVNSLRNRVHQYPIMPGVFIPTIISYSADIGDIDHGYYVDLLTDMSGVVRLYETGTLAPKVGDYRWVEDFAEICNKIDQKYAETGKPVDVTLDTETVDFDPYRKAEPWNNNKPRGYIVCIQVSCEYGKSDLVYFNSPDAEQYMLKQTILKAQLEFLLNSNKIKLKGANLKYDLHWLWARACLTCSNFVFDTTLVGSLLDENRSNGLEVHTKIYVPSLGGYSDEFDRTVDKSRMDLVPKTKLLPYAGGDTDADLQVADQMKKELCSQPGLARFYVNILHPASRAMELVEQGGVYINHDKFKEFGAALEADLDTRLVQIKSHLGGKLVAKHYDGTKRGGINPMKASLICEFMFSPNGLNLKPQMMTEKTKEPSTAMDHLLMFKDHPEAGPYVATMEHFGSTQKTHSTYYLGFIDDIRSDGRWHPTYWLFSGDKAKDEGGTVTGRLSAKNPPFQTIPKHTKWAKLMRSCIEAPPGYVILERDYSQGELRLAAVIAGEQNMIAAYKQNKDLHANTAGPFRGYDYASMMALKKTDKELFDSIRQLGKAGNFGLLYGMGVDGFMVYASANYGVQLSYADAENFRNNFFGEYPGLVEYHKRYKQFARDNGYVASPLGRIRHLPLINSPMQEHRAKAERQAINSPVQATLSDMMLWSLALEMKSGLSQTAPCFGLVHDAGYNYLLEDKVDILVPQFISGMQNLPFHEVGWNPELTFVADGKIGPNMRDLTEFKMAA